MYHILVLTLMLCNIFALGEDEIDPFIATLESLNYNYHSSEVVEEAQKVGVFMANLLEGLEGILEEVKAENFVSVSLKNFENAVTAAKGSKCSGYVPKSYVEAEESIYTAADECAYSVSVDDLESVLPELAKIEKRIQALDVTLQTNLSREEKAKTIKDLKNVFSAEVEASLKKLEVLDVKKALDKCIKEATLGMWTELDSCTKKIRECLNKSS